MRDKISIFFVILSALLLSSTAAYFSVFGLGKLFAGAGISIIIMASVLEFSKIITAFVLHDNYQEINKSIRMYLTGAVIILMIITSAGIYGFLSSAYKDTINTNNIYLSEVSIIDSKIETLNNRLSDYQFENESLNSDISELRKGISSGSGTSVSYIDRETGQKIETTSSSARKVLEEQLTTSIGRRDHVYSKIEDISNTIDSLKISKFDLELNNESTNELGPLIYLSDLTKVPMDKILNYFILMIIFVFDPLAISLVILISILLKKTISKVKLDKKDKDVVEKENNKNNIEDPISEKFNSELNEEILRRLQEADKKVKPKMLGYNIHVEYPKNSEFDIIDNGNSKKIIRREPQVHAKPVFENPDNKILLPSEDYVKMSKEDIISWYEQKNKK